MKTHVLWVHIWSLLKEWGDSSFFLIYSCPLQKPNGKMHFNSLLNCALCLGYLWEIMITLTYFLGRTALFLAPWSMAVYYYFFLNLWSQWLSKHHSMICLALPVLSQLSKVILVFSYFIVCLLSLGTERRLTSYSKSFSSSSPCSSPISLGCPAIVMLILFAFHWAHLTCHLASVHICPHAAWLYFCSVFCWAVGDYKLAYETLIACTNSALLAGTGGR